MVLAQQKVLKALQSLIADILPISMISSNLRVFANNPSYKYVDEDKLTTHKRTYDES